MGNLKLVIVDKFEPLDISANVAREKWAARVRERRRLRYISPSCDFYEWPELSWHILREYAEIRIGNGPALLRLEGMPHKRRGRRVQTRAAYFRVSRSGLDSVCVGMFDDFGRAWACLIETAKEYGRKGAIICS